MCSDQTTHCLCLFYLPWPLLPRRTNMLLNAFQLRRVACPFCNCESTRLVGLLKLILHHEASVLHMFHHAFVLHVAA